MFIPSLYCFIFMYLMSFILVISSNDWFIIWVGLEINMMSFLMLMYRRYSVGVIESCLKYFFIQSLGSIMLISWFYVYNFNINSFSLFILSYKVGAGPFFYWFPSMCSGIDWVSCYFLMFFQKVLPLVLINIFMHWVVWMIIIISLVVGAFGSFNQSNIKQLMAYSSIHHLGWMMMISSSMSLSWIIYLILYGMVLFTIIVLLIEKEVINMSANFSLKKKIWFMVGMLSMAGVPPLLGFYLKWMALVFIFDVSLLYMMILVGVSIIMLYIYIRLIYDIMVGGGNLNSWVDYSELNYLGVDYIGIVGIMFGVMYGGYMLM